MSLPITYLESILKDNENFSNIIYLELDGKIKTFTVDELAEAYTNLYNKTKKLLETVKNGESKRESSEVRLQKDKGMERVPQENDRGERTELPKLREENKDTSTSPRRQQRRKLPKPKS